MKKQLKIENSGFVKTCDEYVHNHEYTPDNSTYNSVTSVRELEILKYGFANCDNVTCGLYFVDITS